MRKYKNLTYSEDNENAAEARTFVAAMRESALSALCPFRADGAAYGLLDYPDHSNVGDVAIWLGSLSLLERLNGQRLSYVSTLKSFDATRCRALIGNGPVYFIGGGNLGDLYGKHHSLRLAAMESLPENPIVQLPQSFALSERDSNLIQETGRIYRDSRVTLFCRDEGSIQIAEREFGIRAHLCPDLAFGVEELDRQRTPPTTSVLKFLRDSGDLEKKQTAFDVGDQGRGWRDSVAVMTWRRWGRLSDTVTHQLDRSGTALSLRSRRFVSRGKVAAGVRFISQGRYLITDRLHGHIFAVMLGIPHTVLDNATGKVGGYYRTWTSSLSFVKFA